jgi:mannose-6-phosphate isomerase-like protein (cupin superfamily)
MLVKDLHGLAPIDAGDRSELREIFHPTRDDVGLRHRLATSEVYYVLLGRGVMRIDDESKPVYAGDSIYIPPGGTQSIENTGAIDLEFLCIVDPAWREEDEEVLE